MPRTVRSAIESALAGRQLLAHPFYIRWSEGRVTIDELAAYAGQYRHVEALQPELLARLARSATDDAVRDDIARTHADEVGDTTRPAHITLFKGFADAAGAPSDAPATAATRALTACLEGLVSCGTVEGLAALSVYELQSADVSASKALGLRQHHGFDGDAVAFWDTHADADRHHAAWVVDALERLNPEPARVQTSARAAADAWWAFLDEREAASP